MTNSTFINLHHGHPFLRHLPASELSAHFSAHYPDVTLASNSPSVVFTMPSIRLAAHAAGLPPANGAHGFDADFGAAYRASGREAHALQIEEVASGRSCFACFMAVTPLPPGMD
ncbi:hypothetical protein BURKHO8Y_540027 [Burkholderia sp. 8Y]|nr:hypothetical protein BURKHO8Y_540027 [Burkholderia sp. 8Y]